MRNREAQARWIFQVWELQSQLAAWARPWGWSSRILSHRLTERRFGGAYRCPALELRRGNVVLILEPEGSQTSGGRGGCLSFYQSPRYDNVWSICRRGAVWRLRGEESESCRLEEESFGRMVASVAREFTTYWDRTAQMVVVQFVGVGNEQERSGAGD